MAEIEGLQDDDEPLDVGNMVIPAGASDKEIEKHFEIGVSGSYRKRTTSSCHMSSTSFKAPARAVYGPT